MDEVQQFIKDHGGKYVVLPGAAQMVLCMTGDSIRVSGAFVCKYEPPTHVTRLRQSRLAWEELRQTALSDARSLDASLRGNPLIGWQLPMDWRKHWYQPVSRDGNEMLATIMRVVKQAQEEVCRLDAELAQLIPPHLRQPEATIGGM
jgi:hypothetical protein